MLDPVTTDRLAGAITADVRSHSFVRFGGENLRMRSDAGPWSSSREFLSAYISGYVDGEGCFTVSISPRAKLAVGWEVRPGFSVSQNGDRAEVLYAIQAHFGCGSIRPDRSDKTLKWETRRLEDILGRVIPHFERYPLLSGKQLDFERFAAVVQADGDRSAPSSRGSRGDRRARSDDESERPASLRRAPHTRDHNHGGKCKHFPTSCCRVKG